MRHLALAGLFFAALSLSAAGCDATRPRKPAAKYGRGQRAAPVRVDAEAQRRAYERGVARFGEDRYAEAREAWVETVRHGPETELGRKAKENLAKVESILRSLRELNAQ